MLVCRNLFKLYCVYVIYPLCSNDIFEILAEGQSPGSSLYEAHVQNGRSGRCHCCPYGYHIDLDFVRYCERLAQVWTYLLHIFRILCTSIIVTVYFGENVLVEVINQFTVNPCEFDMMGEDYVELAEESKL